MTKRNTEAGKKLVPQCRIWIDIDGDAVLGDGRMDLLQAIDECGSINQAAAKLNMSYRAAWGKIKATEERLGFNVVEKHIGGTSSGSELTPQAKKIIAAYNSFREEAMKAIETLFNKHFEDIIMKMD